MNRNPYEHIHQKALNKVRQKVKNKQKIKVAFYLPFSSTFAHERLYQLMLEDDMFEPTIVIIPVLTRGEKYQFENLNETYSNISKRYKKVVNSYSKSQKAFIDLADKFDIICTTNPYEGLTHTFYTIVHAVQNITLPIYIPYGPYVSNIYVHTFKSAIFACFWKIFFEQAHTMNDYSKLSITEGQNAKLFGSAKLDLLNEVTIKPRTRKKIILAAHHSVQDYNKTQLSIASFLIYSDFFLELAKRYPEIDFVFRPHPFLFPTLIAENLWTQEQIDSYIDKVELEANMTYQAGGDYFDTFVNSDAIIHDCGSFIIEYLFTGQPACYMLNGASTFKSLNYFAKECLSQYYITQSREEIIHFIDNVVLLGKDTKKEERKKFFENNLKLQYPHASQSILEYIKLQLCSF